jgi:transposase
MEPLTIHKTFKYKLKPTPEQEQAMAFVVPPAYTSQDCSGCGERVEKSLSVRTHICPSCGLVLDRDENAARNIQAAGQAVQGATTLVAVSN